MKVSRLSESYIHSVTKKKKQILYIYIYIYIYIGSELEELVCGKQNIIKTSKTNINIVISSSSLLRLRAECIAVFFCVSPQIGPNM